MDAKPRRTEREMLALLRAKHGQVEGNGEAYAFVPKVRSAAGFDAKRTLDAIAMALWPSRGLILDGFEVKCSRSDWLRELKDPAKAEEFARVLDRLWVVAESKEIVKDGELPPGWGLLVAHGNSLRTTVQAEFLHDRSDDRIQPLPPGFNRSFLAALLREATRVGLITPQEVLDAEDRGRERERERARWDSDHWQSKYRELDAKVREFEQALGVQIRGWRDRKPADVGAALRLVLDGEANLSSLRRRLHHLARSAESIAEDARAHAEDVEGES